MASNIKDPIDLEPCEPVEIGDLVSYSREVKRKILEQEGFLADKRHTKHTNTMRKKKGEALATSTPVRKHATQRLRDDESELEVSEDDVEDSNEENN